MYVTSHVTHHVTVTCGHLRRIHTQLLSAHSPEEEVSKVLVGECSGQQEACQRAVVPPLILEGLKGEDAYDTGNVCRSPGLLLTCTNCKT